MGMNPTVAGGLIGAGGSLLSSIFNLFGQRSANKANMELAKYNWQQQIAMWERNNEYNTPENQMKRLMAAGLNPNLMYGQGNTGNSTSVPTPQLPHVDPYRMDDPSAAIIRGMQYGRDLELQESQIKNNEALAQYNTEKAVTETYNRAMKALDIEGGKFDLDLKRELRQNTIDLAFNRLAKEQETLGGLQLSNEFNRRTMDARVQDTVLKPQQRLAQIEEIRSKTNLNYVQANHLQKDMELIAEKIVGVQRDNYGKLVDNSFKTATFNTRVKKTSEELTNLILSGNRTAIDNFIKANGYDGKIAGAIYSALSMVENMINGHQKDGSEKNTYRP